jgi:hypothetical protein
MPDSTRRRAGKVHWQCSHLENVSEEERLRIEQAADFKAEQRGVASSFELHDCVFYHNWLEAEREVDQAS